MDRETARRQIMGRAPDFLPKAKQKDSHGNPTYVCPRCANGSGQDGTGITLDPHSDKPRYTCFKCGLHEDIVGLWKAAHPDQEDKEAFAGLYEYFGISIDGSSHTQSAPAAAAGSVTGPADQSAAQAAAAQPEKEERPRTDYTEYFQACARHVMETNYFTARRGLSPDVIKAFGLGFDPAFRAGKGGIWKAAVIPTSKYTYQVRNTDPNADKSNRFRKSYGETPLFNTAAIAQAKKDQRVLIVTEGEIDALSVIEVGGVAMGLGGTANAEKAARRIVQDRPGIPVFLALDNDKAGRDAAARMEKVLKDGKQPFCEWDLYGGKKDANEALVADRAAFAAAVGQISTPAALAATIRQRRKDEYEKRSAANYLPAFLDGIKDSANTPYTETGFEKLDKALDGGLYEGLYIVGAISSLGKTTFVGQIADQIAAAGQDVLIFSLEMARFEIMAKSISRLTLLDVMDTGKSPQLAKTARGITTASRYPLYTAEEKAIIARAVDAYNQYAGNIYISEGIGDIGAAEIRKAVQQHIEITGRRPVVVIDYVQILAPADVRASDKQNTDKAVLELKRISRDFKLTVIGISSFNRENYKEKASMASFKESGAIEYGSDVLLGLQLEGAGEKNFDPTEAKKKNPRAVELVILKNRNGRTGDRISLKYYPMFNLFSEDEQ